MLLTDEEIAKIMGSVPFGSTYSASENEVAFSWNTVRRLNRAQLKKVVEWGNDFCMDNSHYGKREHNRKGLCLMCWQALLEEIT